MDSSDENNSAALDRIRAWETAGATLSLLLTGPPPLRFELTVRVLNVTDSTLAFAWSVDTLDSPPGRSFAHFDGTTVISLDNVSFDMSGDPKVLAISRGVYRCLLREIRASAFNP